MAMQKMFGQNGSLLPGAGAAIAKASNGGSAMPQQTYAQAPKKEADAWQSAVQQTGLGQQQNPKPQPSDSLDFRKSQPYAAYAQQPQGTPYGGTSGQAPNMPGVYNPQYSMAPGSQQPSQGPQMPGVYSPQYSMAPQSYGDPRGNYANMPDGQRPPAFQESAQTPFGTMSPQDFYGQREDFIINQLNQHNQNAQNAGVFGAADLPQNSMPQWGSPASMWPQMGPQQGMGAPDPRYGGGEWQPGYGFPGGPQTLPQSGLIGGMLLAPGSTGPNAGYQGQLGPNDMYSMAPQQGGGAMHNWGSDFMGGMPGPDGKPMLGTGPIYSQPGGGWGHEPTQPGGQAQADPMAGYAQTYQQKQAQAKARNASIQAEILKRSNDARRAKVEAEIAARKAQEPAGYATMGVQGQAKFQAKQAAAKNKANQADLASRLGYTPNLNDVAGGMYANWLKR